MARKRFSLAVSLVHASARIDLSSQGQGLLYLAAGTSINQGFVPSDRIATFVELGIDH